MTDAADRDRTLARVRTTTAVTGIGALVAGGVLAGWLGHAASADASGGSTGVTTEQDGSTADDGLTAPDDAPTTGGDTDDGQPGVVSGGS